MDLFPKNIVLSWKELSNDKQTFIGFNDHLGMALLVIYEEFKICHLGNKLLILCCIAATKQDYIFFKEVCWV